MSWDIPHDHRPDGNKEVHAHLYTADTAVGDIVLEYGHIIAPNGSAINHAVYDHSNTTVYTNDTVTQYAQHMVSLHTFTTTCNPGGVIMMTFRRLGADPGDTYLGNMFLVAFGIHYTTNHIAGTSTYA